MGSEPNAATDHAKDGKRHVVETPPASGGDRLDRMLAQALPALSRSRLKQLIETGAVTLHEAPGAPGRTIEEPAFRVKSGQIFAVFVADCVDPVPRGQRIPLDVVFEDEDVIVLDKEAGLVVHPAAGNPDGTLVNALIAHCGDSLSGIGGVRRPGIVHRLDKATSGLMVAAKNDLAHRGLTEQFKARSVARAYTAFVWGRPRPARGEVEGNIGRSPRNRKKMAVLARGGRPALTRYRVTGGLGRAGSILECRLATGRTHQIRVHMANLGYPVMGDATYGGGLTAQRRSVLPNADAVARIEALDRQALHARLLGFVHPRTGEALEFESELPNELNMLRSVLEEV